MFRLKIISHYQASTARIRKEGDFTTVRWETSVFASENMRVMSKIWYETYKLYSKPKK